MGGSQYNYNWYALAVSILANCIPEMAFRKLESSHPNKLIMKYTKEDIEDMYKLKKTMTYKELAEIYCSTPEGIYHVMKRRSKGGEVKWR